MLNQEGDDGLCNFLPHVVASCEEEGGDAHVPRLYGQFPPWLLSLEGAKHYVVPEDGGELIKFCDVPSTAAMGHEHMNKTLTLLKALFEDSCHCLD